MEARRFDVSLIWRKVFWCFRCQSDVMQTVVTASVYYLVGSVVVGMVLGAGFATNLGGPASEQQLKSLQRLGVYIPFNLDGIDGALVAKPGEPRPTIVYV